MTEILHRETLTQQVKTQLEMVQRNTKQMLELVNKMLHYSKSEDVYINDNDVPENVPAVQEEEPYELLYKSYSDGCKYYGQLKKEGKLIDMTMSEFADHYREKKGVNAGNYNEPECAPWRDILYGSDKQLFWYCDPYMRACVNMEQGGAINMGAVLAAIFEKNKNNPAMMSKFRRL